MLVLVVCKGIEGKKAFVRRGEWGKKILLREGKASVRVHEGGWHIMKGSEGGKYFERGNESE